jgi:hypothetical protein
MHHRTNSLLNSYRKMLGSTITQLSEAPGESHEQELCLQAVQPPPIHEVTAHSSAQNQACLSSFLPTEHRNLNLSFPPQGCVVNMHFQ